jgi:hypothetical protein
MLMRELPFVNALLKGKKGEDLVFPLFFPIDAFED